MAKRFSGTEKWDDPWFMELSIADKLFWIFLCDKCDNAGIWKFSERLLSTYFGEPYNPKLDNFNHGKQRISRLTNGDLMIQGFCEFQYGSFRGSNHPFHKKLVERIDRVSIGYGWGIGYTPQDKDKEQDKVKEKEQLTTTMPVKTNEFVVRKESMNPAHRLVKFWKRVLELPKDDYQSWDKANFGRCVKSANLLLEIFRVTESTDEALQPIADCMSGVYEELTKKGLSCTLETVVKKSHDWKNGGSNANYPT